MVKTWPLVTTKKRLIDAIYMMEGTSLADDTEGVHRMPTGKVKFFDAERGLASLWEKTVVSFPALSSCLKE